jgi:hypothetical protein
VTTSPKFGDGELVYHRVTKEDGEVSRSYEEDGVRMCEVFVRVSRNSCIKRSYTSDWAENRLEFSS